MGEQRIRLDTGVRCEASDRDRAIIQGRRVFALEDIGKQAPWEVDLTVPALFVVGGERHGIAGELLERAEGVLGEPDQGINTALAELWMAFEELGLDPTSSAARYA